MADQLFLSLWYPNFRSASLGPAILGVLRQFATIGAVPGQSALVKAATVYPIDWSETPVYARIYDLDLPGDKSGHAQDERELAMPARAVPEALEQLHDDFAYEFETDWYLWQPQSEGSLDTLWRRSPSRLRITGYGPEFDTAAYETNGQLRIAFGTDTPFLQEEVDLDPEAADRVRENVAQLVALVHAIEKNCGISSRLLWSESGDSLAEKLIARLQRVN